MGTGTTSLQAATRTDAGTESRHAGSHTSTGTPSRVQQWRQERVRLEQRQLRIGRAVHELRRLAEERRQRDGTVPEPLSRAIDDFARELKSVRAELARHHHGGD